MCVPGPGKYLSAEPSSWPGRAIEGMAIAAVVISGWRGEGCWSCPESSFFLDLRPLLDDLRKRWLYVWWCGMSKLWC